MGKAFQLTCALLALTLVGCSDDDQSQAASSVSGAGAHSGGAGNGSTAGAGSTNGGSNSVNGAGSSNAGAGSSTMGIPGKPGEVGGCKMFPADDAWNLDISGMQVDEAWTQRVRDLVRDANLHPDYGADGANLYGIPLNVVPQTQPLTPIAFDWYPEESDPGPYPFPGPADVIIEGNNPSSCEGDCHLLVVQQGSCMLYEGYACEHTGGGWRCGNGAKWDLSKVGFGQRPDGWTSADAAGLAIAPGVLRYDEVRAGEVTHALRFTLSCTTNKYVSPASHYAVPGGCNAAEGPPMGTRVRLRADFKLDGFSQSAQTVLRGMQKYGMILADNGSDFYFQGQANPGWTEDDIEPLKDVPASAFEVVTMPPLRP